MRSIRGILVSPWGRFHREKSILRRIGIAGFTLLELAIVIEIIGFLSTIVISNYFKSKKAAEVAVTMQNIRNVQVALASYFAMESRYPATLGPIWLQFYNGRIIGEFDYCTKDGGGSDWNFFLSNDPEIRFNGPGLDEYAIKSKKNLLPYAIYVYGDVATGAKAVH